MIPLDKIYFILYYPGGCGSFVQSLLQPSKKYSDTTPVEFNFKDGTGHAYTNDCFRRFKGIDLEWNLDSVNEGYLEDQEYYINAFSSQEKLMSLFEEKWRNYNHEYYSHRFHTLGFYKLIELLPQSKFIYCRLNPIKAISNIQTKLHIPKLIDVEHATRFANHGKDGFNPYETPTSPKYNFWNLYTYFKSYNAIEEFIKLKKPNNLLTLDIDNLIYDDNTKELDKLINFTNITDVSNDVLKNIIHQYRHVNNNLKRMPIWDKFLIAYEKLNK